MRLHRFIGPFDFNGKTLSVTDTGLINQWKNVLRLKTGDQLILCDGMGREALAQITDADKKEVRLAILEIHMPEREPKKELTLYCALLKRENFELVCQKATEIGVARIVPLLTERTVKTGFNKERLEKIILEASEQSGRTTVPELAEPMKFSDAIDRACGPATILFDLTGEKLENTKGISNIFIGPEGGFSENEVALAKEGDAIIGSLGGLVLRGETAAIAATFLLAQ